MTDAQRELLIKRLRAEVKAQADKIESLTYENDALRMELKLDINKDFAVYLRKFLDLRPQPAEILMMLHNRRGNYVSRDVLNLGLEAKVRSRDEIGSKLVETQVCMVRRKIGRDSIITEYYSGYRLSDEWVAKMDVIKAAWKAGISPTSHVEARTAPSDGFLVADISQKLSTVSEAAE